MSVIAPVADAANVYIPTLAAAVGQASVRRKPDGC